MTPFVFAARGICHCDDGVGVHFRGHFFLLLVECVMAEVII